MDADHDGVIDGANDSQLFKSFGSFFVGLSAECKIALGATRTSCISANVL